MVALPRVQYSNSCQLLGSCLVDMTLSIYTTRSSSPPGKVSVWSKLSSVLPPLLHVPVLVTQLRGLEPGCMPRWTARVPLLLVLSFTSSRIVTKLDQSVVGGSGRRQRLWGPSRFIEDVQKDRYIATRSPWNCPSQSQTDSSSLLLWGQCADKVLSRFWGECWCDMCASADCLIATASQSTTHNN